jgi:hypothetical protein
VILADDRKVRPLISNRHEYAVLFRPSRPGIFELIVAYFAVELATQYGCGIKASELGGEGRG